MQTVESIKTAGQERLSSLVEKGKEQPEDVKTWGVTIGAAALGAVTVTAVAKGVVAVLSTIASPPVALTIGALGGGALGWSYMHNYPTGARSVTVGAETDVDTGNDAAVGEQPAESVPVLESVALDPDAADNLEAITGIGPVYADRLRKAGIQTYAQLAELTPEHVQQIIGPIRSGSMIDAQSWIAEAQQLSAS
ncbi:MAG: DUF4332 domain-containing protein [Caldilineaceae bacterium]|nr:DUF4332 domain-containing protein [Caldilineaceae bacterium]MCB9162465.1 DUF4332 domain-containing protein [Caldilineaceae bacterium]